MELLYFSIVKIKFSVPTDMSRFPAVFNPDHCYLFNLQVHYPYRKILLESRLCLWRRRLKCIFAYSINLNSVLYLILLKPSVCITFRFLIVAVNIDIFVTDFIKELSRLARFYHNIFYLSAFRLWNPKVRRIFFYLPTELAIHFSLSNRDSSITGTVRVGWKFGDSFFWDRTKFKGTSHQHYPKLHELQVIFDILLRQFSICYKLPTTNAKQTVYDFILWRFAFYRFALVMMWGNLTVLPLSISSFLKSHHCFE